MAQLSTKDLTTLPVGRLGLIPLESCQSLGSKVNDWLVKWRQERNHRSLIPLLLKVIREIPTSSEYRLPVLVPEKENP